MIKKLFFLFFFFSFIAIAVLNAQENKLVILNLKTGYSVKGEIIEQSDKVVKIKTLNGEIFEYRTDEISSTTNAILPTSTKKITKVLIKGDKVLNLGIGLGGKLPYSRLSKLTIPPIPISFEYVIKDDLFDGKVALGCGGFIGYSASKQTLSYYSSYGKEIESRLIIGVRGYVHYTFVDKLDTYTGMSLGYKSVKTKLSESSYPDSYPDTKSTEGTPTLNVFAGCRYFFNDKIAGMAELGWGVSILNLGLAMKF